MKKGKVWAVILIVVAAASLSSCRTVGVITDKVAPSIGETFKAVGPDMFQAAVSDVFDLVKKPFSWLADLTGGDAESTE